MTDLFDMDLRARRRDRAARIGAELFLFERAFADCLERIGLIQRRFERALIVGCPDPGWPQRLGAEHVEVADPGSLFARTAAGTQIVEDRWQPPAAAYDLILAIGTLDTVNGLPLALRALRHALRPDSLLIGAVSGGDTLPRLRAAIRGADQGAASPRVHPRIEASALAPLLSAAGFVMPVVDVDRVQASYRTLQALVADLRRMGATNILTQRARTPITRSGFAAACHAFASEREARTVETFEILHFAAWTPAAAQKDG